MNRKINFWSIINRAFCLKGLVCILIIKALRYSRSLKTTTNYNLKIHQHPQTRQNPPRIARNQLHLIATGIAGIHNGL
jgi:hypothetical protein